VAVSVEASVIQPPRRPLTPLLVVKTPLPELLHRHRLDSTLELLLLLLLL
jgi:hypothetical protein